MQAGLFRSGEISSDEWACIAFSFEYESADESIEDAEFEISRQRKTQ